MKILITGSESGLGKFLSRELNTEKFSRKNSIDELLLSRESYDLLF